MSQSKFGETIYGYNVTHSPSLNPDGSIKSKYRKFPSRIIKGDAKPSYFDSTLMRIDNSPRPGKRTGRLKKKKMASGQVEQKEVEASREGKTAEGEKIKTPVDLAGFPNYCGFIARRAEILNQRRKPMSNKTPSTLRSTQSLRKDSSRLDSALRGFDVVSVGRFSFTLFGKLAASRGVLYPLLG